MLGNTCPAGRRAFLRQAFCAVPGLVLLPELALSQAVRLRSADQSLELFAQLQGTAFLVYDDRGAPVEVRLHQVDSLRAALYGQDGEPPEFWLRREPFSLLFRGPMDPKLADGIYELEHPATGRFSIFLAPVGQPAEDVTYQAVFT